MNRGATLPAPRNRVLWEERLGRSPEGFHFTKSWEGEGGESAPEETAAAGPQVSESRPPAACWALTSVSLGPAVPAPTLPSTLAWMGRVPVSPALPETHPAS